MPLAAIYSLSTILGWISFAFQLSSRRRIIRGMQFAFKEEKGSREIERLTRESMVNFFRTYLELFSFTGPHRDDLLNRITIEGREYLDHALTHGRGIITVSAHLNNFTLMVLKLAHEGYTISIAIRDFKDPVQSRIYTRCRRQINLNAIKTRPSSLFLRDVVRFLEGNGIICLIADENKRHGGVFVDFFGHPAATATGPAHLAIMTNAPIIPVFMVRYGDTSQKIVIEPPLDLELFNETERDIEKITSGFTKILESYVRRYPSQWRWDHFRWKTQPVKGKDRKRSSQLRSFSDTISLS